MNVKIKSQEGLLKLSKLMCKSITAYDWMTKENNEFRILVNRFCLEDHDEDLRCNTLIVIKNVTNIFRKKINKNNICHKNYFFSFLNMHLEKFESKDSEIKKELHKHIPIVLSFSNNLEILVDVESINISVFDVSKKWHGSYLEHKEK